VYMSYKLKFFQLENYKLHGAESIWLKISKNKSAKTFVIGFIYRHPSEDANKFIDDFSKCLETLSNDRRTFYILGDTNINISKASPKTHHSSKYLQAILSNGAYSLINKPTRVTDKSPTLIDHIITNDNEHSITPRVILSSLTDHYAIMCKISKFGASQRKQTSLSYYRCKNKFSSEAFSDKLHQELNNLVLANFPLSHDNFDHVFDLFVDTITKTIDKHAPLKPMSHKHKNLQLNLGFLREYLPLYEKKVHVSYLLY